MSEILIFKLITGEEVLGEVESSSETEYVILNPVGVAVVRGQDGRPNVGFAPFPAYAEESKNKSIDFRLEHVIYSYTPAEDFCKNYEQIFGLGLVLPGEKKIITG